MHINQMKESKFLKKEDCGKGILVTIRGIEQANVAVASAPEELKWTLIFEEDHPPMVLNATNTTLIASITGESDTDNWIGHKIVLFHDPSVMYAGKVIGGIRVRAPKNIATKTAPTKAAPPTHQPRGPRQPEPAEEVQPNLADEEQDDVPF